MKVFVSTTKKNCKQIKKCEKKILKNHRRILNKKSRREKNQFEQNKIKNNQLGKISKKDKISKKLKIKNIY